MYLQKLEFKTIYKLKNSKLKKIKKSNLLFEKPCFYCLSSIADQINDLEILNSVLSSEYGINSSALKSRLKSLINLYRKLSRRQLAFEFALYVALSDCLPF